MQANTPPCAACHWANEVACAAGGRGGGLLCWRGEEGHSGGLQCVQPADLLLAERNSVANE